jgi:hypothetical protein
MGKNNKGIGQLDALSAERKNGIAATEQTS